MQHRKQKCAKCGGRGGKFKMPGPFGLGIFVACTHCLGRGAWWPNNRPKSTKQKGRR